MFPADRVQQLADAVPGKGLGQAAADTLKAALRLVRGESYRYLLPLLVLAGLVLLRWNLRALPALGTLVMCGAEVFYLTLKERMPGYVEVPLLLATALLLLAACGQADRRSLPSRAVGAVCLVCLAVLVVRCVPIYRQQLADSRAYRQWAGLEQSYFEAMSADKENLYLLSTESINVAAGLDVWHPRTDGFYSNIVAYGGWLSHAPHRQAALEAYGLQRPLVDAVDNPHVYLGYQGIQTAAAYVSEQLGVEVVAVDRGENDFASYQLVTAGE